MFARYTFVLLAVHLVARPAEAGESQIEPILDTCSHAVDSCLGDSALFGGHDASCDDHFCPHLFMARRDCWYFQADMLILNRTSGRNRPLVSASDSGDSVLATSDLDLGFQPGLRLLVGHRTEVDRCWELSYFGLQNWSASADATDRNNLDIPGTLVGAAADYSGADRIALNYSSSLYNVEANLVRDRDTWSALSGLRYLHLQEKVVLTATDSDSGRSDYTAHSQSDLIGAQLGMRSGRLRDRWGWELTAKAGLYVSLISQQQLLLDNANTFLFRDCSARVGSAAFLGDINFVTFRRLNDVWLLRGGYYAMYVAGVALATDQLDFDNLATSGQRVSRGDLFLHGASLGFEARW